MHATGGNRESHHAFPQLHPLKILDFDRHDLGFTVQHKRWSLEEEWELGTLESV